MMAVRALKRAARRMLGRVAPVAWRRLRGPSLVVLTYHRVLPDNHADRAHEQPGMYVRPETLGMHLATLREHFDLVHLDDWLDARIAGRPLPRLACAITFDDGWRDNHEYAFPLLSQAAVPATIFLVSGLVGGRYSFWPNRLARQLARTDSSLQPQTWPEPLRHCLEAAGLFRGRDSGPPGPEAIDRAIVACKALSDAQMHDLLDQLPPHAGSSATRDLLSAEEVRQMATTGLIRFGSHTRRHTRLRAGTSPADMRDEIVGSAEEIEQLVGVRPRLFCYPNGDFTPEALRLVREHYRGAAASKCGWNSVELDPALIRRVGMHEDVSGGRDEFLARLDLARSSA